MSQKRFLTAIEVFQLFGIDASGLEKLIKAGDVEALQDQNTFRYRSDDFAKLVKAGKIKPRASAEMFQIDDDDVPYMDLKDEDKAIKFDEDMLFLELDEKALAEQAAKPDTPYRTPVVPEKWFDDTDVSIDVSKSKSRKVNKGNEETDVEMKLVKPVDLTASDSDVRIFTDNDEIDLDSSQPPHSGSDSDVRLVGPVTSSGSNKIRTQPTKKASDSDVTLVKTSAGPPQSDSDVELVSSPADMPAAKRPAAKFGDSDSDVRLSSSSEPEEVEVEEAPVDLLAGVHFDGDSAIRFERSDEFDVASVPEAKLAESASDIPISQSEIELVSDSSVPEFDVVAEPETEPEEISEDAIEILLDDEEEPVAEAEVVTSDEDIEVVAVHEDDVAVAAAEDDVIEVAAVEEDDDVSLESDIVLEDKHDPAVVPAGSDYGSGIVLEQDSVDSGMQLEQTDSGVRFVSKKDSDIVLADSDVGPASEEVEIASVADDSAVNLVDAGSGIHLEGDDSGITLESNDSGISLLGPDSGITLEPDDSGIRLGDEDSGISLEGDSGISLTGTDSGIKLDLEDDSNATFAEIDQNRTRKTDFDATSTDKFDLSGELEDASSDVNIEHTLEIDTEDSEESSATTAAYRGPSKRGSTKQMALSEAFQLDQQPEVEDLDISDDLDSAGVDFTSGDSAEFIPSHDDVLDVSDEAFSVDEVPAEVDEPATKAKKQVAAAAAKKKVGPREPSWGIVPVGAVACAAVVMLATVTVLWGGLATMWTGQELPGPAGAIVSMLGNLF